MSNRFLIAAAYAALTLLTATAQAQTGANAALLEQLSPADRQKALQALQGGQGETSDAPRSTRGGRSQLTSGGQAESLASTRAGQAGGVDVGEMPTGRDGLDKDQLPLFGYDLFTGLGNGFEPSADVPIPQNYILGPGDIVRVQLFGNQNETLNLSVTRDGSVNFPKLGPIQVAGLSVDDARAVIDRRVAKELIGVQTNITLGPLRGVQVFLLGDARQPGAYAVSGLATISNALTAGGGVATTGSLRKIELKRAGRVVQRLDLYDFLLRGDSSRDVRLQAGDAVFIPPVGPRATVAGAVTRPAVYEMSGALTVKGAIELAGGLAGNARRGQVTLERVDANGQRQLRSLDVRDADALAITLRDGDRLEVSAVYEAAENPVTVSGHVRYEKSFAWNPALTLRQVLSLAEVRPSEPGRELYPVMALVERTDPVTGLRNWKGFDLAAVQTGAADEPTAAFDRILVLTRSDIAYLQTPEVRDALRGKLRRPVAERAAAEIAVARLEGDDDLKSETSGTRLLKSRQSKDAVSPATAPESAETCPGLLEVVKMSDSVRATGISILIEGLVSAAVGRFGQAAAAAEAEKDGSRSECPKLFQQAPTALPYLLENSVGMVGEVRQPGLYPFVVGTPIGRLTAVAGGETREAASSEVEFFDASESISGGLPRFRKLPRDAGFAQQPTMKAIYKFLPAAALPEVGAVNVRGEVRFPGRYVITRGERYSDVIARAGGLNDYAFALGTVFTRISAREQESASNRRAAADLRESLFTASTQGINNQSGTTAAGTAVADLLQKLETAPVLGRVVIEADPALLGARPGADFLLEPGDEIFVPKRPNAVTVTGQVLSAGSLAFVSGSTPEAYIKQAGGYSEAADKSRAFLVLPNGIARPLRRSFWTASDDTIPPGSVIVVPRDVAPFTPLLLTERISSIVANLALSAAALVTINR
ncbi:MAG: SLBB domain-containing protein [Pseudomonadota bacterium]